MLMPLKVGGAITLSNANFGSSIGTYLFDDSTGSTGPEMSAEGLGFASGVGLNWDQIWRKKINSLLMLHQLR
jgi:hypothetical protein